MLFLYARLCTVVRNWWTECRQYRILLSWIPNIMVLLFGVLMVYDGKLTMGYLITAQSLSNFVISPGRMVSDAYAKLKASKAVKEKLEDILSETAEQPQISAPEDADNILVKNLSFTYPGAALPALKHISLSFSKHQKIALIGSSGSGKSGFEGGLSGRRAGIWNHELLYSKECAGYRGSL